MPENAECDRLGDGCPCSCQWRTNDQYAAKIFGRNVSRVGESSGRRNGRSSARSTSRCNSTTRLRRRMSGLNVAPFAVTNTVAMFGPLNDWLTPSNRSHHSGDEMKASNAADDSRPFWLSSSTTILASRTTVVSIFLISSSSPDATPVGKWPSIGTTAQETSVVAPAPSAFFVTMKHGRSAPSGRSCAAYKPTSAGDGDGLAALTIGETELTE